MRCAGPPDDDTSAERLKGALAALSGTVSFQNAEHDIVLEIGFDKRGNAAIHGAA